MTTYVPVAGTHDWDPPEDGANRRWWQSGSDFTAFMDGQGFVRYGWSWQGLDLPPWGCALAGTMVSGRDLRTWWRGAYGLAEDLERLPYEMRNLICHSYGGSVGVMVALLLEPHGGLRRLVTVCTPNRRAMKEQYAQVSCPWLHLYNTHILNNRMQWLGARGAAWKMPEPARNVRVKGCGHSRLLREHARFEAVYTETVLPFLEEAA